MCVCVCGRGGSSSPIFPLNLLYICFWKGGGGGGSHCMQEALKLLCVSKCNVFEFRFVFCFFVFFSVITPTVDMMIISSYQELLITPLCTLYWSHMSIRIECKGGPGSNFLLITTNYPKSPTPTALNLPLSVSCHEVSHFLCSQMKGRQE